MNYIEGGRPSNFEKDGELGFQEAVRLIMDRTSM